MTRKRKTVIVSMYVVLAGLLFAMGAAARYAKRGPERSSSSQKAQSSAQMGQRMMGGQMGQGMMGQNRNMMATREKMRDIVDELMENQAVMERAKSVRSIRPLLEKNRVLLKKLSDEMVQSWGMHGHMYGAAMPGRMSATAATRKVPKNESRDTTTRSAAQSHLIARGKEVFAAHGCRVCHGAEGVGTAAGPSLVGLGKKYSAEKIGHLIRHPATARMPKFSETVLRNADLKAVIAYVETLKK